MTTNKRVEERVEEFDDKFRWLDDLEVSATGMSYANKSAYGTLDEVKDWLRTTLTQHHQDMMSEVVEKLEGMKLYAETSISSTDYGNIQNALLKQHVESHNQALTEAQAIIKLSK